MASTHKHIRSSTANKRPTTAIADGQIALNTNSTSPGLFFKDSTGATIIKIGPVHIGATAPNASPAAGGSAGNSTGEIWLDNSLTPVGVKIWDGSAWVNATPIGSTTVQGLLELATNAETQTGADTARAVTPAGLQSKLSDSTSTTSSTTIASSTAVKSAYDLANAALPKSGGTVTGNLEIGTTGSLSFEGATADAFETTIAVVDPTADRTITLPDTTGTIVTTGDTGTVTSTMIADGTIVNADVNASAAIAGTKISPDFGGQTIATTGIVSHALGTAAAPTVTFTGDTNTGIYSPGADQVAISTNGTGRLFVDSSGNVGVGNNSQTSYNGAADNLVIGSSGSNGMTIVSSSTGAGYIMFADGTTGQQAYEGQITYDHTNNYLALNTSGSERLRITSAGLVGIGTSSPSDVLHVEGTIRTSSSTNNAQFANNFLRSNQAGTFYFDQNSGGQDFAFRVSNVSNLDTTAMTIKSSGRVGVGTSSPDRQLTIAGAAVSGTQVHINSTSSSAGIKFSPSSGDAYEIQSGTDSKFSLYNRTDEAYRITVDGAGNVGVGTTSPGTRLHVDGDASTIIRVNGTSNGGAVSFQRAGTQTSVVGNLGSILGTTDSGLGLFSETGFDTRFYTNGSVTERMRLDTSGRLLVGTSSASGTNTLFESSSTTANAANVALVKRNSGTADQAGQQLHFYNFGPAGTARSADTEVGSMRFYGSQPTSGAAQEMGRITCAADLLQTGLNTSGRLVFSTTADGASSPTEAIRINSQQNLLLSQSGSGIFVGTTSDGAYRIGRSSYAVSSGTLYIGNAAIQVSSDVRLKDNIEDTSLDALDAISKICVKDFTWNDPTDTSSNNRNARGKWTGLIAQELVDVLPFVVNAPRDENGEVDYESESTWTLDQSQLCPVLIKAIQQQQEMIAALEARLSALEAQ